MTSAIAFVGAGPTTIYTLNALMAHSARPMSITIFEQQGSAGRGTPYRPGWNDPAMLSNIASVEIPPLEQTLVEWLDSQSEARLAELGIDRGAIDERTFYPRLALGEFFFDQLQAILERARANGSEVTVRTGCRVVDAISGDGGMTLVVQPKRGEIYRQLFDHVVLATGHQWPKEPEVRPGYFLSPWPASALSDIPPTSVGIRGSSLSAIDAAVALSVSHGEFVEEGEGELAYQPNPDAEAFRMTMLSRKGLLPEADFYFPIPYEPLSICTPEAIAALLASEDGNLLDDAFFLFQRELAAADPDYARRIGLSGLTLETFCESYFKERLGVDPFIWAERNLVEAQADYAAHHAVPWRYAILRMHEVIELLVPHLEQADFKRFSKYFKPVFVDDYATVPHESIKRMLALHRAGKLEVIAVGDDYHIDSRRPESGAVLQVGSVEVHFPIFIEATGQRALSVSDFPFPSLIKQGIVRDAQAPGSKGPPRGIVIDDEFHPVSDDIPEDQLFCLSLPFLLGRHPFIQGITSSHEMGLVVGEKLAAAVDQDFDTAANAAILAGTDSSDAGARLLAVYVGGELEGANIELHDVRFVVAASIKEAYPQLRRQWWGIPRSLHIDCWAELSHADGYAVSLRPEPFAGKAKLYFVNLGGYHPEEFAEKHRNVFVVSESEAQAKRRAIRFARGWAEPHRDEMYEAEHVFCLSEAAAEKRLYVHLSAGGPSGQPAFTCRYIPIGRKR
ncbi:DUF1543 domain-containing protein [Novosphingobium sp. PS1R-30]|uniref:DUF1543 domain-containing protein n=1 Tax=Novosphingobium anseongense TaxID=3133436 RepID=A0ABU8RU77_9SPHN